MSIETLVSYNFGLACLKSDPWGSSRAELPAAAELLSRAVKVTVSVFLPALTEILACSLEISMTIVAPSFAKILASALMAAMAI